MPILASRLHSIYMHWGCVQAAGNCDSTLFLGSAQIGSGSVQTGPHDQTGWCSNNVRAQVSFSASSVSCHIILTVTTVIHARHTQTDEAMTFLLCALLLNSTASLASLCYRPAPPVALQWRRVRSQSENTSVCLVCLFTPGDICTNAIWNYQPNCKVYNQKLQKSSGWVKIFFFQWKCPLLLSYYTGFVKIAHVMWFPLFNENLLIIILLIIVCSV